MNSAEADRIYGNRDVEESDVLHLIDVVFDRFASTATWPEVERLQHELDQADDELDVDEVGQRLPGILGVVERTGQPRRVRLTLRGVRKAAGYYPVLNDTVRLIQEAYRRWNRDGEAARLSSEDMLVIFDNDPIRVRRAYEMALQVPGALWNGTGGVEGPWDRQVSSTVRPYRKLVTVSELLAILYPTVAVGPTSETTARTDHRLGQRVFLVHGHDTAARDAVEAFLRRLGAEVTVLNVKPSMGRTIAEKLEVHAAVDYAVVILSADYLARAARAVDAPLMGRARQNVILTIGYFTGSLGRNRVAAIRVGEVEIPSDLHGVVYITFAPGWQLDLLRELQAVGLPLDYTKA